MNKDFTQEKLLSFVEEKQLKILYDLASFIENKKEKTTSSHFEKLKKYHSYLSHSASDRIQKLNKEFHKVKQIDYQFQIYLMHLERFLGQSKKEYEFISTKDNALLTRATHPITCLLDSVRSAHNIGAMIRNAECFGLEKIVLTGLSPTPKHAQVIKTAMGCEQHIKWEHHKDPISYIQKCKSNGQVIWSIETGQNTTALSKIKEIPDQVLIIFGHEQFGVSNEIIKLSDKVISIDLYGVKNSLNAAVAQGIVLNHIVQLININESN